MTKKNILNSKKFLIALILIFVVNGVILGYFWSKKETAPVSKKEEAEKEKTAPVPPEEVWEKYTSQLGFSMKIPQTVYGVNRCSPDETIWVPVKVFEDKENGIVFITQGHYYDNWDSESQSNTGPCEKITYSLELLQDEWETRALWGENDPFSLLSEKTFLGWGILIGNIKSESELNKFVKDNYGPGCFAGKKELWKQKGVYEIEIESEDPEETDLGTATCPINYAYKILYAPEKNKIMSVRLGQECTFGTDPASYSHYKCYDEEMIDSFEFE